jgi:hypothetical protein
MATRRSDFRHEVIKADPEWPRDNAIVVPVYNLPNNRKFRERTATSGPYAPVEEEE